MSKRIREPFGKAGLIVAALAVVFAMIGGAYAAENSGDRATTSAKKKNKKKRGQAGLNGKQKRQVMALAKRFAGKGPQGPQGVPGPQGSQGLPGADGLNGAPGQDGSDGEDGEDGATGATGPEGPEGEEGSPWTVGGTLPSGATETGVWAFGPTAGTGLQFVPFSFPIPLPEPLNSAHVRVVGNPPPEPLPPGCPGSVADPQVNPAEAGEGETPPRLCIYVGSLNSAVLVSSGTQKVSAAATGTDTAGGKLFLNATAAGATGAGTFAVTTP